MARPPSLLTTLGTAVLAILRGTEASGAQIPSGLTTALRRSEEEEGDASLLLAAPRVDHQAFLAHSSHSSHSSHASHSSHYSGSSGHVSHASHYSGSYSPPPSGGGSYGYVPSEPAPPPPRPHPPRPARVTLIAYPGGRISVDGRAVGQDTTSVLTLQPGQHEVRVENQFLGDTNTTITLAEGQTGVVLIQW